MEIIKRGFINCLSFLIFIVLLCSLVSYLYSHFKQHSNGLVKKRFVKLYGGWRNSSSLSCVREYA